MTSFADVAPLALMSGSTELIRAWVTETLGSLADDDAHHALLRATLRVFLQESGSFVAAGEPSLFVRVTARHRQEAFQGSMQIIERLKQLVPIWKHPIYAGVQVA